MPFVNVADVDVKYHQVEVPESCPMCGSSLATRDGYRRAVRELNLASANYYGTLGREDGDSGFTIDPAASEEHPSDAVWVVFGYECGRCGEILATGTVGVD